MTSLAYARAAALSASHVQEGSVLSGWRFTAPLLVGSSINAVPDAATQRRAVPGSW